MVKSSTDVSKYLNIAQVIHSVKLILLLLYCSCYVVIHFCHSVWSFWMKVFLLFVYTVELVQSDTWVFRQKYVVPKYFWWLEQNLGIPTSCTIRHISLVPSCVGLDRFHCICIVFGDPIINKGVLGWY
jgi:hypothetical protein